MKRSLLFLLAVSALCLIQCEEDPDFPTGELVFSIAPSISPGEKAETGIPDGSSALITLRNDEGKIILSLQEIKLFRLGYGIVSEPLRIASGNYTVEDFIIMRDHEALFVTPKKDSRLASSVKIPLPSPVVIKRGQITNFPVQVVRVVEENPEDLGYTSLPGKPINSFRILVFTGKNGKLKMTTALLRLLDADSILLEKKLTPNINIVPFTGDEARTYALQISKDGFQDVIIEFNYREYTDENGVVPLSIFLLPEESASFTIEESAVFYLTCVQKGEIEIEWPDGESETLMFEPSPGDPDKLSFHQIAHAHSDSVGTVTLFGDLDKVVEFASVTRIESMDISHLRSLHTLTVENASLLLLDLRNNFLLESLSLINSEIITISLPQAHRINNVLVEGTASMVNPFPLEKLINDIYHNAVFLHITEGAFILFNAGDLTPDALEKLRHLQDAYDWYIEIE